MDRYLDRLREIPFVEDAALADAVVRLTTNCGDFRLLVERKQRLTPAIIGRLAMHADPRAWLLVVPHIPRGRGEELRTLGFNFVDEAGNCFLQLGDNFVAHIEGRRRAPHTVKGRGLGTPGYRAMFALLAEPLLRNATVRELAAVAGIGKTAAADLLRRLEADGILARDTTGRRLARPDALMDRWLAGYADRLRPQLLIGRFAIPGLDPGGAEARIAGALKDVRWALGAGAAAFRLTGHYRGEQTVIHLAVPLHDLEQRLRALRANDGPITALAVPCPAAFDRTAPGLVHPLLIYTELLMMADERAREAAAEIRETYLNANLAP